jgi:hypothetical protein
MTILFTLVGDSNVRRHVNSVNKRACPQLSSAQIISCGSSSIFDESLSTVRKESTVLILSCITNFLTGSSEDDVVGKRVEPLIDSFLEKINQFRVSSPGCGVFVSPPMYRHSPVWYRDGLPEILTKFSLIMTRDKAPGVHLLPSFSTPEFEKDGIHLTWYSGLEYLLHLFDASESLLTKLDSTFNLKSTATSAPEATRVLEDRVMVLEQDHRRLNKAVEYRAAVDAELHDYHENVGFEDFFIISGKLKSPASGLSGPEWQRQAIEIVQVYMRVLLGSDAPILFIQNISGRGSEPIVRFQVKTEVPSASREIRNKFGKFFARGEDKRPDIFKKDEISIRNRVTHETHVRIAILQVIARRYQIPLATISIVFRFHSILLILS